MLILAMVMLTMIASGCAPEAALPARSDVICDATSGLSSQHAAALAVDGGVQSVTTGRDLIATLDAGCRTD